MSRFVQSFATPYNPQQVMNCFNSYMQREGFEFVTKDGESYWKKGMGLLTAPQYIKLTQTNGGYVLEAWLKFALLPGVYIGEMGLKGFFGAIPKALLKERVDNLLRTLQAHIYAPNNNIPPQINMNNGYPVNGTMPPQMHPNQMPPASNGQPYMNMPQGNPVNGNVPSQANMNTNPYQNNQNNR